MALSQWRTGGSPGENEVKRGRTSEGSQWLKFVEVGFGAPGERASGSFSVENGRQPWAAQARAVPKSEYRDSERFKLGREAVYYNIDAQPLCFHSARIKQNIVVPLPYIYILWYNKLLASGFPHQAEKE